MRKQPLRHSTSGYTVIEMITVMVIIGVLAAIAAPGWLAFMNSRRANAARDQILQSLRQAQAEAIRKKEVQAVNFNTGVNPPTITALGVTQQIGDGQLTANQVTLQAKNGATNVNRVEFSSSGNVRTPDLDPQGLKITVIVPPTGGAKRCVIVQTLLGAMRAGSDAECN
jgi:prepilin-type N-terminal cleavage/methylation domain-containing protein